MDFTLGMPELPEVETIVRELKNSAVGKTVDGFECYNEKQLAPDINEYKQLMGLNILDVKRRGKFIIFDFDKLVLVIHLRMTGRLMWHVEKGREKFVRAVLHFTDGTSLYFSDVRKFARIWLFNTNEYERQTGIFRLGIDPFDSKFTVEKLDDFLTGKSGKLKSFLLKQDKIAGIGNIYADEICFRSGIHPGTNLSRIRNVKKLHESIRFCLGEGIKHCGVSVSDFVGTRGDLGKHQNYLNVYGRKGEKCYVCGNLVQRTVVAGRGTFFCGSCQKI